MKKIIMTHTYASPCGTLLLGSLGNRLCLCDWRDYKNRDNVDNRLKRLLKADYEEGESEVIRQAEHQLDEFFAGQRQAFDIPLLFAGTDFQKSVWQALLMIPYGKTVSYADLAAQIARPKAVRAVAAANGANAIAIFVPCHRVVGSDHSLTGYAGGLAAKELLLNLEK